MFINATGFYVPEERVDNQHFSELLGHAEDINLEVGKYRSVLSLIGVLPNRDLHDTL